MAKKGMRRRFLTGNSRSKSPERTGEKQVTEGERVLSRAASERSTTAMLRPQRYPRKHALLRTGRISDAIDPRDWELPPKPQWMRWGTYNRLEDKFDAYEKILDRGVAEAMIKLLGYKG